MIGKTDNKNHYMAQIQLKRDEMIQLGLEFGLASKQTVACSQELDSLLNEYNRYILSLRKRQNPKHSIKRFLTMTFFINKTGAFKKKILL
ncbi:aspartyl-phosphate phosphatase Spo0E family protein [Falsibacillus pallidus]|uniref:Spo0E like sporulation regulatory protein n=1 Tax=Falsibacillus pallidus TaxID=493781 RepID=A0A370GWN0_9BACI|nr:aspartyl-phosphate phosphatase Spo0E family protein [Falsibacillus pallidus]RDI47676.1 Spo0E like sporulation regulatory protein [Falsibacillus pallidus]